MGAEFLVAEKIHKSFAGVTALRGVDLRIRQGEIRCLVGENGCGKSTLIKVISGVYQQDQGLVIINGKPYQRIQPIEAIREGIQVIYQDFSLFPNLTVAENVALNYQLERRHRLIRWKEVKRIAQGALEQIDVHLDLDAYVEDLTIADKQLIAISRALLQNAKLIIMDEPTTALTRREVDSLFRVVKGLKKQGISILFVSHKLNEVIEIADQVTVMRNGCIVADAEAAEFDQAKITYLMTGRSLAEQTSSKTISKGESPLLQVKNLTRRGGFDQINFDLYPGEVLGITGLLGSGRTELAMALFGLRPAERGQIYLDGQPTKIRSVQDAIANGIGYVPEDRLTQGLFLARSISRNIIAGSYQQVLDRFGFLSTEKIRAAVKRWLANLNIATPSPELPVQSLSGGNQQRVVLAKWLATAPRILILNGPTVGVDVGSKAEIHAILRNLAEQGIGVIIISDDIPELLHHCDRILLMQRGRIVQEFGAGEISENELASQLTGA